MATRFLCSGNLLRSSLVAVLYLCFEFKRAGGADLVWFFIEFIR